MTNKMSRANNTRPQSNLRLLKSRNKREGWYAGKHRQRHLDKNWWEVKNRHRRTKYKGFPV